MPYTITHAFHSAVADKPSSSKVKPSDWNSAHAIAGSLLGNEIINIPTGVVTATDVQSAVNQLASLIPLPGPGTDPLALVVGMTITTANPTIGPSSFKLAEYINITSANANLVDPQFSDVLGLAVDFSSDDGDNSFGAGTNAKTTIAPLDITHTAHAAGQIFGQLTRLTAFGMGDSFLQSEFIDFASGPIAGDEGQGFVSAAACNQQQNLSLTSVASVTRTTFNTTVTQIIVGSKNQQTVTVASTVGANPGDWVIVQKEVPTNTPNAEAIKIISVSVGTITAVFRNNHASGVTLTPALVLGLTDMSQVGQGRVLVNLSGVVYNTGTVISSVGAGLNGSATVWANNVVGGDSFNIGAIQLDKDTYTGAPFAGSGSNGPLKSWFQIKDVGGATFLDIYSTTVAGDSSYRGHGSFPTTYSIRPAVAIFEIDRQNNRVICETTSTVWTFGDSLEEAICPYPDVSLFQYSTSCFTPGGSYRALLGLGVKGGRKFDVGIVIGGSPDGTNGADLGGVGTAFSVGGGADIGFGVNIPINTAAMQLRGDDAKASRIEWSGSPQFLQNNNVAGMDFCMVGGANGTGLQTTQGTLNAIDTGVVVANLACLNWNGMLRLTGINNVAPPLFRFDSGAGFLIDFAMRANPTACILGGSGLDVVTGGFTAFALNQAGFGTAVTVQTVPSSVTLANGTNNDIAVAASFIKIAGPTGAFAITGFIGPLVPGGPGHSGDGMILRVYNTTAQQMTITNLATSSADRQIRTLTGADVVLRAGTSYATFTYDNADVSGSGKWILTATN